MYIHQGKVLIDIEEPGGRHGSLTLGPGQSIHIIPLTKHRLQAIEDTTLFEVSTPELNDVTRLADDYGRTLPGT